MQQRPIPNKSSYPLLANFWHPNDENFIPIKRNFLNQQYSLPISTGNNAQLVETTEALVSHGKQLALSLVEILTKLKARDESAIYPIAAIFNSFFEVAELDLRILPIPSTEISGSEMAEETTQPEVTDVREESFFRFLDELEAGAYSADDKADEE